ncbi:MAG TPA: M20/M25/M40 family metallo-hydrolase [Patescibacteria group bacterium]|nr:M20/M25/M40 family metallo-hydrolase [Patescibacteria group bacterium]
MFNGEKAFKHLEKLAVEIGSRNSGSENERKAAEYIESEFRALGLKTWLQEFEVETGEAVKQSLLVLEPYHEEIECSALPLAGGTGPEGVEGELVYIESVSEEYIGPEIDGKVIMTQGFYRQGIELFTKYRPLGVISLGRRPRSPLGHGWGTAKLRDKYGPMPIVNVTFEDGLKLLESGASRVRLVAVLDAKRVKSQNVVGELEGSLKPEEVVLVGGHYDTVPDIPGASDNGGGTAVVMELARIFKEKGSKRTMRFIAWGCEECGCVGSSHDASTLKKEADKAKADDPDAKSELDRVRLVVNADVQGGRIGSNSAAALGPVELKSSVKLLAKETGVVFNMGGSGGGIMGGVYSSDGTSYSAVGVPSLNFIRGGAPFIHSVEDSMRWLSPEALQMQGEFMEKFLTRYVAEAVAFPFERTIPEDDKKAMERYYKNKMTKPPGSE